MGAGGLQSTTKHTEHQIVLRNQGQTAVMLQMMAVKLTDKLHFLRKEREYEQETSTQKEDRGCDRGCAESIADITDLMHNQYVLRASMHPHVPCSAQDAPHTFRLTLLNNSFLLEVYMTVGRSLDTKTCCCDCGEDAFRAPLAEALVNSERVVG